MKLHLGCGNKRLDGFINVDILQTDAVDIIDDVSTLEKFENMSADLIYACHVLEHFKRKEYFKVLERWTDILRHDGTLRLSVPDFSKVCQLYSNGEFKLNDVLGLLFGGQTYLYNFHYMVFDYDFLKKDLQKLGYRDIRIWDWKTTEHSHVDDFSQAYLPHMDKENGTIVSLNIEATKK